MKDENGLVRIPLGDCTCPGTPHAEGDYVKLLPKLGMARSLAVIRSSVSDDIALVEMSLGVAYARFGIAEWNLVGDSGPLEVNGDNLEHFTQNDPRTVVIAMHGDQMYAQEVIGPLAAMAKSFSAPTSTANGTSATNGTTSSTKNRKRSKPSSITTIPTADTVTTSASLDGDSSS